MTQHKYNRIFKMKDNVGQGSLGIKRISTLNSLVEYTTVV